MTYTSGNIIQPFWADSSGFIGGRDALGIQNSSITVYGRLLPGLTNLTERLRYYSFYCWLLKEYDIRHKEENLAHHYNFFRRAELIIAYLMTNKDDTKQSVVGVLYAGNHKGDIDERGYYDVEFGADKLGVDPKPKKYIYWDYTSGALGQYYLGSLINLNLVEVKDKFFCIKEKGRKLAGAFGKSIPEAARNYFLELINTGKLTIEDIDQISSFNISDIPFKSDEWMCLIEFLIEDDGEYFQLNQGTPSMKRRETIALYLKYKQSHSEIPSFPQWIFENTHPDVEPDTANFGWYYYYINEAFHFALQSIFWVFLENLDGRIVFAPFYIQELQGMILQESSKTFTIKNKLKDNITAVNSSSIVTKLEELREANAKYDFEASLATSIELMLIIYIETTLYQSKIKTFENLHGINFQPGHFTENIQFFITSKMDYLFEEFTETVIKGIMNKHTTSAYRKMGNGDRYLLKYMVEDNMLSHIETVKPRPTTPRIKTLDYFLKDLHLLSEDGEITPEGMELYKELL